MALSKLGPLFPSALPSDAQFPLGLAHASPDTAIDQAATKAKRVLVVEDDPSTSNALRQLLTAYGYQVMIVASVAGALAAIDDSFTAVILDLMLPDGDGADVLRKVRGDRLKARVCVTTGVSSPIWLDRIRALAPDCILQKPIDLSELLEKL